MSPLRGKAWSRDTLLIILPCHLVNYAIEGLGFFATWLGLLGLINVNLIIIIICIIIATVQSTIFFFIWFDLRDSEVPTGWDESDACIIENSEEVKLRSFSTNIHR